MIPLALACAWLAGCWLALAVGGVPAWGVAACLSAPPILLGGAWLVRARPLPAWALVCGAAALLGMARVALWLPTFMADPLAAYRGDALLRGVLEDTPAAQGTAQTFTLRVDAARGPAGWDVASGGVRVVARASVPLESGDRVEARGVLEPTRDQPGFPQAASLRRRGIHDTLTFPHVRVLAGGTADWRAAPLALRRWLEGNIAANLAEPHASLLRGILLGGGGRLPADLRAAFVATGTSHLVAVSGANVAIVAGVVLALGLGTVGRRRTVPLGLLAIAGFTLLVGAPPSAVRAAIMAGAALLAGATGRPTDALLGLVTSAALMVGVDPSLLEDLGFQLSCLATLGLVLLVPRLQPHLAPLPRWAAAPLAASVAATAFTLPLQLLRFHSLPLAAIPVNVLADPLVGAAMALGAPLALFGWVPGLRDVLVGPAWFGAALLLLPIRLGAGLPGLLWFGALPPAALIALYAGLLAWLAGSSPTARARLPRVARLVTPGPRAAACLAGALGLATIFTLPARADGLLHLTFLQAGGDGALLLRGPHGARALVGGSRQPGALAAEVGEHLTFWERSLDFAAELRPGDRAGQRVVLDRYPAAVRLVLAPAPSPLAAGERVARAGQTVDLGDGARLYVEDVGDAGLSARIVYGRVEVLLPAALPDLPSASSPGRRLVLLPRSGASTWRATDALGLARPELVLSGGDLPPGLRGMPVYTTAERSLEVVTDGRSLWLMQPACPAANGPPGCSDGDESAATD